MNFFSFFFFSLTDRPKNALDAGNAGNALDAKRKTKRGWPKQGSVPIDLLVGQFCACNQESTGTTFSTFTATSVAACFMENI